MSELRNGQMNESLSGSMDGQMDFRNAWTQACARVKCALIPPEPDSQGGSKEAIDLPEKLTS